MAACRSRRDAYCVKTAAGAFSPKERAPKQTDLEKRLTTNAS